MKPTRLPTSAQRPQLAFTLVELMVAVTLMTLIILALYAMFNQTQKALRSNITQVDVLESGRAAMELMSRELEHLNATGMSNGLNLIVRTIDHPPVFYVDPNSPQNPKPFIRTNALQEFYFISREVDQWTGIGYRLLNTDSGVGTLYRISTSNAPVQNTYGFAPWALQERLTNEVTLRLSTNLNRVADGIVHLQLKAYDASGRPFFFGMLTNHLAATPYRVSPLMQDLAANVLVSRGFGYETQVTFRSNAVPAYLELELGVLESETYDRFRPIRGTQLGATFLRDRPNKVHIFRQRIPIRTAASQ